MTIPIENIENPTVLVVGYYLSKASLVCSIAYNHFPPSLNV
jgi:hypothetical protein